MAYSSGDLILDDHYNVFATGSTTGTPNPAIPNVNTLWGVGDFDQGYGQNTVVSSVSPGTTVSATQWASLMNNINLMSYHQPTTINPITDPITGDEIDAITTMQSNINNIALSRFNATANGSPELIATNRTTSWDTSVDMTTTITFGSYDQMRFFFNAGGVMKFSFSRSGGAATAKNQSWTDLCNACGTIAITSTGGSKIIAGQGYNGITKLGGSGSPNVLNYTKGFHQLTSSYVLLFRQYAAAGGTYTYSANRIELSAKVNGPVLTVLVRYTDEVGGTEDVTGTLITSLSSFPPSTAYIVDSWGSQTLAGSETGT